MLNLGRSITESPLPGTPSHFNVWVKSADGDHKLSIQFKDAGGEIFRLKFGFTIGNDWQRMSADLVDAVSLGGDGSIDYPISFFQFYLESFQIPEFPFYGSASGTIYLDDLTFDEGGVHVYDYQFFDGGEFLDVIWTTDEGVTRSVPFPASSVTVTDVGGSSTPISDGGAGDLDGTANGAVTVGATDSPVFVAPSVRSPAQPRYWRLAPPAQ